MSAVTADDDPQQPEETLRRGCSVVPEQVEVGEVDRADRERGVDPGAAAAAGDDLPVAEDLLAEEEQPEGDDGQVVAAEAEGDRARSRRR